jgi:flavin reductase (DIM6/NTAB) family NADH-FMN oxidoreductase RutF
VRAEARDDRDRSGTLTEREIAWLMLGVVVPRPIAWVSTLAADGTANLAPHSYFMAVSSHPPIVMFVSTHSSRHDPAGRKDTLRNVEAMQEFVVNLVSEDLLEAMNRTAEEVPPEIDEFALAALEKSPSVRVKPPRVARARIALECRQRALVEMGDATVIFGDVLYVHIADEVWRDGRVDAASLQPMARLGGSSYATLGKIIHLPRP